MKEYLLGEFLFTMSFMIGFVLCLLFVGQSIPLFILGLLLMVIPIVTVVNDAYKK